MNILVTGASGHLGLTLIPKLLAQGHKVRVIDLKKNTTIDALPVEFVQADTRNIEALEPAFRDIEIVYHLAAYISIAMNEWPILEGVNVNGTRNVVNLCQKYKVQRLVHCSSIEALTVAAQPITEANPLVPKDFPIPYPRSKSMGQRIVQQAIQEGLNAVIIYPTGIIGPNDYGFRATNQSFLGVATGDLKAVPRLSYDFVDVRDVAEGLMDAQQLAAPGSSYILGNRRIVLADMVIRFAGLAGLQPPRPVPGWVVKAALPIAELASAITHKPSMVTRAGLYPLTHSGEISHERATRDLGYQNRPLEETLTDTVKWMREIGKIR